MKFSTRQKRLENNRDKSMIRLPNSTDIMASGISTIVLSSDPNKLCDRLRFLLQEKQAGSNSNLINQEIVAIVDKLLKYKCISQKQHKQLLIEGTPLHNQKYLYVNKFFLLLKSLN